MVRSAEREEVPGFALIVKATLPEPFPDPVTVTHEALDELVQLHPAAVVTVIVPVPPVACAMTPVGETETEHVVPLSDNVNCLPAIVSVTVLALVPVFAAAE